MNQELNCAKFGGKQIETSEEVAMKRLSTEAGRARVSAATFVIFGCLATSLLNVSTANAEEYYGVQSLMQSLSKHPVPYSESVAAAQFFERECSRLLDLVPRLSPTKDKWLDSEIAAGRDPEDIMEKPEFAKRALYAHFTNCVNFSRAASLGSTEKERIIGWANLVSSFMWINGRYYMRRAGAPALEQNTQLIAMETIFREKILDNIVLPYLEKK